MGDGWVRVSFCGDKESVLNLENGDGHNSVNILKTIELYMLNGSTLRYVNYISIKMLEKEKKQQQ